MAATRDYKQVLDAWRETPLAARPFARYYLARHPESPLNVKSLQTWLENSVEYAALVQPRGRKQQQRVFHDRLESNSTLFLDTMYFRRQLKGGNFALVAIDGFSGRVWFRAMRNLDARNAVRAFTTILESLEEDVKVRSVLTDKGIEFKSKLFAELLNAHDIHHITTTAAFPNKAFKAERVIRTLRNYLGRQIRMGSPQNLPLLLERAQVAINLRMIDDPSTVFKQRIARELAAARHAPSNYRVGDTVLLRLSDRSVFAKSNEPVYGDTLFTIIGEVDGAVTQYRLEDVRTGDRLDGSFAPNRLRRASHLIS